MSNKILILFAFICVPFITMAQQEQTKSGSGLTVSEQKTTTSTTSVEQQARSSMKPVSTEAGKRREVQNIKVKATRQPSNVTPKAIDAAGREVYSRDENH